MHVHWWTRTCTCSAGPTPLPLCLGFFLLHFSILDNTPRIDIKQKWIINRGQERTSFQSRERVKSEGSSSFKKDGETDRKGALLSRGFSEPYVGSHRLMGRLVPGLPGILQCTSPNTPPPPPPFATHSHTHLHAGTHAHTLLLSHDNHLSHPSHLHSVKIPPPLSSNLTFFSGADPGRPTLFPTARQKPALWSEPEPLRWFPLSSPFSLPWLPASPTALLYWFTPPTNAVCLCFAPPAPRSLISITLPSCPFSLFPSHILSFFLYFLSIFLSVLPTQPWTRGENLTERTWEKKERRDGRMGVWEGKQGLWFFIRSASIF